MNVYHCLQLLVNYDKIALNLQRRCNSFEEITDSESLHPGGGRTRRRGTLTPFRGTCGRSSQASRHRLKKDEGCRIFADLFSTMRQTFRLICIVWISSRVFKRVAKTASIHRIERAL